MTNAQKTTVAHILLGPCSDINFAHVVGEMQRSLGDCADPNHRLEWKEDDIAIFDLETTRIVFAIESFACRGNLANRYSSCLMISVGPPPDGKSTRPPNPPHDILSEMIVNRITSFYQVVEVVWQSYAAAMDAEAIDIFMTDLPLPEVADVAEIVQENDDIADIISAVLAEEGVIAEEEEQTAAIAQEGQTAKIIEFDLPARRLSAVEKAARKARRGMPAEPRDLDQDIANAMPDLPRHDAARLQAIRAALYAADEDTINVQALASTQTRLAVTAMDVTMVMVCLPVGAAMLTYHVFRGGELRRCAQMMTITGLFLSVSDTAIAQQLMSFI